MQPPRVVAFGELLLRLSAPSRELLLQSPRFETSFGGAEANVAVALASLGSRSRLVTALPEGALGDAALAVLNGAGVDTRHIVRAPGRLGLYFVAHGAGPRASEVIYDRAESVFSKPEPSSMGWHEALADAAWLHLSGVTLALSAAAEQKAHGAMAVARERGVRISFDCNFRARLWAQRGGDPRRAVAQALANADLAFADYRDLRLLTGVDVSDNDVGSTQIRTAERLFESFPNLRWVASVRRDIESHDCHTLTACIVDRGGNLATSPPWRVASIVDRIGGGDAFAAGLLHVIDKLDLREAITFAGATGALKHTLPGDMFRLSEGAVLSALLGASDVRR